MKKLIFPLLFLLSANSFSYYGIHSSEAHLKYKGRIEIDNYFINWSDDLSGILGDEEISQELNAIIDYQIQFLMGSFSSESFKKKTNDATATIGKHYEIKLLKMYESSITEDSTIIEYEYQGKVLVHRDFFGKNGSNKTGLIPITLPLNPNTIYDLGIREIPVPIDHNDSNSERELTEFNLCTDDHYNGEDDFFYFWDPDRLNRRGRFFSYKNCPLRGDKKNVVRTTGTLERIENSYQKYFEYDRLYSKDKLKIFIFLGYLDDIEDYENPNKEDYVFEGMYEILSKIKSMGFKVKSQKKFVGFSGSKLSGVGPNYYTKFQKLNVPREVVKKGEKDPVIDIEVEILLADTGFEGVDKAFHHYYRKALKNSDIIIYDGHSGLGANLDLEFLEAKLAAKDKYQIVYLNGCSGYPYFRDMYFDAKAGGSKNLDLILSGISTLSDTIAGNLISFTEGFLEGKTLNTSYILQKVEAANFDANGSYLTGIMGEEDNTWTKGLVQE